MKHNDIDKELEEKAPFLAKVKRENPHTVPDGYFERMEEEILQKLGLEIDDSSPPAGYFEALPDVVDAKVGRHKNTSFFRLTFLMKIAASVIIILGAAFWFVTKNVDKTSADIIVSNQEMKEALDYLETYEGVGLEDFLVHDLLNDDIVDEDLQDMEDLDSIDELLDDLSDEELENLL